MIILLNQVVIAHSLGYLMDRALGLVRRRRANAAINGQPAGGGAGDI